MAIDADKSVLGIDIGFGYVKVVSGEKECFKFPTALARQVAGG